jgi:hypothetical protein
MLATTISIAGEKEPVARSPRKGGLRLRRKDGRCDEGSSKQTAVSGKDVHLCFALRSGVQACTSITTISPPPPFSSTLLLVV